MRNQIHHSGHVQLLRVRFCIKQADFSSTNRYSIFWNKCQRTKLIVMELSERSECLPKETTHCYKQGTLKVTEISQSAVRMATIIFPKKKRT